MKYLDDMSFEGQRALIRMDFNVPLDDGIVDDNHRILASVPTIKDCRQAGAAVVLMSHLGRPQGRRDPALSLLPVAEELELLLDAEILFSPEPVSDEALKASRAMKPGEIHLLENLRFDPGEESNDDEFAARLAGHGSVYLNDAFGTAHRAHASNVGVVAHFSEAGIGQLMARELKFLKTELAQPERPYVVVLGGAKVGGKLELIRQLATTADRVLIGGAMAITFLKARGYNVGRSKVEDSLLDEARAIVAEAVDRDFEIVLPRDLVAATSLSEDGDWRVCPSDELGADELGVDIGPETCAEFGLSLENARTIFWNGPLGVVELAPFRTGTEMIIATIEELTSRGAVSVVGGGETAAAINRLSDRKRFTHISTGGAAALALLSGQRLPALEALS